MFQLYAELEPTWHITNMLWGFTLREENWQHDVFINRISAKIVAVVIILIVYIYNHIYILYASRALVKLNGFSKFLNLYSEFFSYVRLQAAIFGNVVFTSAVKCHARYWKILETMKSRLQAQIACRKFFELRFKC